MSTLPWQDFGCRKSFISPTPRSFHRLESLSKRCSLARSQNSTSKPSSPVTIWISSGRAVIGSKCSLSSSWPSTSSLVSANNCLPAPWNGLKLCFFWVTKNSSPSLGFRDENVSWQIEENSPNTCEVGKHWSGLESLSWNLGIVFFAPFSLFDIIGSFDFPQP